MRYIKKSESPEFFEECKKSLPEDAEWEHFENDESLGKCKKDLKIFLIEEQKGLCIYCERKISAGRDGEKNNSHFEHILPKDKKTGYPELTFEYGNLTISCNGDLCDPEKKAEFQPNDIHSCGHKKGKKFERDVFLNPVKQVDIHEYFSYDLTLCSIMPSDKNDIRSSKTIKLLNLDNPRLNNERSHARMKFVREFHSDIKNKEKRRINAYLGKYPEFISFLRYWLNVSNKELGL